MSPIQSSPNRGYADWQRIDNYDSGVLISATRNNDATPFTSAIVDVSRYANISGNFNQQAGNFRVTLTWFADSAGTTVLGVRKFVIDGGGIAQGTQYVLRNGGPFVQMDVRAVDVNPLTYALNFIGTNREYPVEAIPQTNVLLDFQPLNVASGQTSFVGPQCNFCGPVFVYVDAPNANSNVQLRYHLTSNIYDDFWIAGLANGANSFFVTVPLDQWQLGIFNGSGAAAGYTLTVVACTSGAS